MFNNILNLLTNRNNALIYSVTICKQKTKDYVLSGSFQEHKLQHCCFHLCCLLAFITSVLYYFCNYVFMYCFQMIVSTVSGILGDSGADSGDEEKSKRAEKYMARRKVKNGEKSPWGQCLTRPVPNGRRSLLFFVPYIFPPV